MIDLSTEAVRAALDESTPGPWFHQADFANVYALSGGSSGSTMLLCKMDADQIKSGTPDGNAGLAAMAPDLAAEVLRLRAVVEAGEELAEKAQWFIDRCERGEVRSVKSKAAFEIALDAYRASQAPREGGE